MSEYTRVASADELPPGKSTCVELGGEKVALFNVDGRFHAIGDSCTHVGGPLSEGELEGTTVTCPWHGATFDLETGAATGPPARGDVPCYDVRVEDGQVLLRPR